MKRILVAALAMLIATAAFSQGKGIIAGVSSSQVNLKSVDSKSIVGFHAGVAYNMPIALGFAIQPAIIYNVKGSSLEDVQANYKLGFIEVPVQVQWGITVSKFRPYVFAEPFIGYTITGTESFRDISEKIDLSDVENRLEYGLGIGAGLQYKRLQLSLKYYWNFDDANFGSFIGTAGSALDSFLKDKSTSSFDGLVLSAGIFF